MSPCRTLKFCTYRFLLFNNFLTASHDNTTIPRPPHFAEYRLAAQLLSNVICTTVPSMNRTKQLQLQFLVHSLTAVPTVSNVQCYHMWVLQKNDPHKYRQAYSCHNTVFITARLRQSHRFSRILVVTNVLKDCTVPFSGWSGPSRVAVWQDNMYTWQGAS